MTPNTRYYVVVEAMPPVAPCSGLIVITNMDGATDWNGNPFNGSFGGIDVPRSNGNGNFPNRAYKVKIGFKTPTTASGEFVDKTYIKYRMECSTTPGTGNAPYPGGGRVGSAQKQALVP